MKFFLLGSLIFFSIIGQGQEKITPLSELLIRSKPKPLICSHRGGYYIDYPENSISVFNYIYEKNEGRPVMFEIDIRADKNGNLWLLHDEALDRTTNGKGLVKNMSTSQLEEILLKDQAGNLTKEKIPAFEDILKFIKSKNIYLMLDIKGNQIEKVLEKINQYGLDDRCIVLTFTPENTNTATQINSKCLVSSLITTEDEYKKFKQFGLSNVKLVAYVTDKTPTSIIKMLKEEQYLILSDPREVWNKNTKPLSISYYKSFVSDLILDILVTDFPIEVGKGLLKQAFLENKIHTTHLQKFKWFANQQYDSLATLLHDDIYYIHSNGWKETKAEVLDNIKSGKLTYTNVKVHESDVRVIDKTGVVTGKGTFFVSMDGKPNSFDLYYTEVYVLTEEGIKLISRHACKY